MLFATILALKRHIELVSMLASGHQPPPPKKGPGDPELKKNSRLPNKQPNRK